MSGLGVHPWLTETTEQHRKNLSDLLNPRNKLALNSLGTLSDAYTLQAIALHPLDFADNIVSSPL